ncbi:hypothetical protein [Tannockella kyphosi]|uniref:hypothetical protein n=1 Tax=Tannockella kyphosi TaxID=2899121 RepID=UPI002011D0D4|nr:hypothetical protein [Tannockella kyphosi]
MLLNRKQRVLGQVVEVRRIKQLHYLVYSFETKDGQIIQGMDSDNEPLEYILTKQGIKEYTSQSFPIKNIKIIYHKKNPCQFHAKYL